MDGCKVKIHALCSHWPPTITVFTTKIAVRPTAQSKRRWAPTWHSTRSSLNRVKSHVFYHCYHAKINYNLRTTCSCSCPQMPGEKHCPNRWMTVIKVLTTAGQVSLQQNPGDGSCSRAIAVHGCTPSVTILVVLCSYSWCSEYFWQWRSQPEILWGCKTFGEAKFFYFRRATIFCLKNRLSKHTMIRYFTNLGGHGPLDPPDCVYDLW